MPREDGSQLVEDYFDNTLGLNTSDSPFLVPAGASVGGQNYDLTLRGGLRKRPGHSKLNTSADTQLKTLGLSLYDSPLVSRAIIRSAGTKIQHFDDNAVTFTNLSEDTAGAGTNFLNVGSVIPVVSSMYNTPTNGVLWLAGGGMSTIYGAYSSTKVTAISVADTSGTLSTSVGGSGGTFAGTGKYYYAVSLQKASTGAEGNAKLDVSGTISATTQKITVSFASLAAVDTTKYTILNLYRSAVGGVSEFTTGDLVSAIDISGGVPSNYIDSGTSVDSAINIPRIGSLILDNRPLPSGTFTCVTTWKRRLVTANNSTLRISEVNKPENFPLVNDITVPSGGPITGVATVSYTTPYTGTTDELLVVFKQRELWVVTGDDFTNFGLKHIDNSGCPNQALIVAANGYLLWLGYRGVFMWDGSSKPTYISQPIEDQFKSDGTLDKSRLIESFGIFAQERNEVQWYLSDTLGHTHAYVLRLDLRLTTAAGETNLAQHKVRGVFTPDVLIAPVYAAMSCLLAAASTNESIFLGDNAGSLYQGYTSLSDAGTNYTIQYTTPYLYCGVPGKTKRFNKVVLWVLSNSAYDMTLNYWANYRFQDGMQSSIAESASSSIDDTGLVFDVGNWDEASWDNSNNQVKAIVFNLNSTNNNNEGDAIRLQFSQTGDAQDVIIYGYSVYYSELGMRK